MPMGNSPTRCLDVERLRVRHWESPGFTDQRVGKTSHTERCACASRKPLAAWAGRPAASIRILGPASTLVGIAGGRESTLNIGQLPPELSLGAAGQRDLLVRQHQGQLTLNELYAMSQDCLQEQMKRAMLDGGSDQHLVRG